MNEAEDRVISPEDSVEDLVVDASLRPKTMDEYIGQPAMREKLGIFLEAAKREINAMAVFVDFDSDPDSDSDGYSQYENFLS